MLMSSRRLKSDFFDRPMVMIVVIYRPFLYEPHSTAAMYTANNECQPYGGTGYLLSCLSGKYSRILRRDSGCRSGLCELCTGARFQTTTGLCAAGIEELHRRLDLPQNGKRWRRGGAA